MFIHVKHVFVMNIHKKKILAVKKTNLIKLSAHRLHKLKDYIP